MSTDLMPSTENQVALNHQIEIYQGASLLIIKEEEQKKLTASFDRSLIEIRPDGMIYLPQVFWRGRLNESFGIGQWCLVPKSQVKDPQKSKLYIEGIMMVRGHYVATAVGEAEYRENNANQSWATVWESAKSDCITRCCKDLGIASELWQPEFIRQWINEFAVKVFVEDKDKKVKVAWRKKTSEPFWNERKNGQQPAGQNQQPAQQSNQQQQPKQGTSAYNHKSMEQQGKPVISNANFKVVCERLEAGEVEVYDQTLQHFSLDQTQLNIFKGIKATLQSQTQEPADESITRVVAIWSAKVDKQQTIEQLTQFYEKNKETIEAHPVIKNLFTSRKIELQKK